MAGANLPAKMYKKTAPTQLRLSFEFSGNSTQFIDIAQALSAINRKFYRQGVYYYVNSVEMYNNEDAFVDIHTLPDNWCTKNAWNRGFAIYQQMNALTDVPRPKYHDFKVYMSDRHRTAGSTPPALHDINSTIRTMPSDNWVYSQYVSADDNDDGLQNADEFFIHMLGPHVASAVVNQWTSIGLIESYHQARSQPDGDGLPVVPVAARTDPLTNLFDFSSEEQINAIIENLDVQNDDPPYDVDTMVGRKVESMQHVARLVTTTSIGRTAIASGFCAPFGLICVDPQATATAFRIVLNLAPGTYHGVYAERA